MTQEPKRKSELKITNQLKSKYDCLRNFQFRTETRLFEQPLQWSASQVFQSRTSISNSIRSDQRMEQNNNDIVDEGTVYSESGLEG